MQLIVFGQFIIVVCIPMIHICIPVDCIWTFMNSPWMSMVSRAVSRCAQGVGAAVHVSCTSPSFATCGHCASMGQRWGVPRGVVVPWGPVWCVCVWCVCVICYTVSHICCISCISCMCGMAAVKLEWSHSSLQNLSCVIYFDHIPVLSLDAAFFFLTWSWCFLFVFRWKVFPNRQLLGRRYLHRLADSWQTLQLQFRAVKADQGLASKGSGNVRKHMEQLWNNYGTIFYKMWYNWIIHIQLKSNIEQHYNVDRDGTHLAHPSPFNLAESHVFDPRYVALTQRDLRMNCREVRWLWPHTKHTQTGTVDARSFCTFRNYWYALERK